MKKNQISNHFILIGSGHLKSRLRSFVFSITYILSEFVLNYLFKSFYRIVPHPKCHTQVSDMLIENIPEIYNLLAYKY